MAGNVKVGGNVIATHTGAEGAGTVTLSNVTASAIKMSSSGNTITDSAGNAVLSESGGTVNINKGTVGSNVIFPAGHILQIVYNQKTDRAAISTSTWTDIPGTDQNGSGSVFSATITPTSTSSKILVTLNIESAGGETRYVHSIRLYRGTTAIGLSDQIGSRSSSFMSTGEQLWSNYGRNNSTNSFLDSPSSTSLQTYSVKVWDTRDSNIVYINRAYYDSNDFQMPVGTSSIMLMEIAG